MAKVADGMANALLVAIYGDELPNAIAQLYLTDRLPHLGGISGVMFSGGVAEYVYDREPCDFGDLGKLLGLAVRQKLSSGGFPWELLPAGECIRATALGASEYSVQLSGNTTYISNPAELLPRRNLQVLTPTYEFGPEIVPAEVAAAIKRHYKAFDLIEGDAEVALAFRWRGAPLFIVLDGDIAQTLGRLLREELDIKGNILVIDGVTLWDFDYVDLGRIRLPSFTVPVTVKSLVFNEDPRALRRQAHGHSHHHGHGHQHHHDEKGHTHA